MYIIIAIAIIVIIVIVAIVLLVYQPSNNNQNNKPGYGSNNMHSVGIDNLAFNPTTVTVPVGIDITWTANGLTTQTITATSGPVSFGSG